MESLRWVDHDSIIANVKIEQVAFDVKDKTQYDEEALVKAMNGAFPGSSVMKKPG